VPDVLINEYYYYYYYLSISSQQFSRFSADRRTHAQTDRRTTPSGHYERCSGYRVVLRFQLLTVGESAMSNANCACRHKLVAQRTAKLYAAVTTPVARHTVDWTGDRAVGFDPGTPWTLLVHTTGLVHGHGWTTARSALTSSVCLLTTPSRV